MRVVGAFREHHTDHRERAIAGLMHEMRFHGVVTPIDRVFRRGVKMELGQLVEFPVPYDAARVHHVHLQGVAIVNQFGALDLTPVDLRCSSESFDRGFQING